MINDEAVRRRSLEVRFDQANQTRNLPINELGDRKSIKRFIERKVPARALYKLDWWFPFPAGGLYKGPRPRG